MLKKRIAAANSPNHNAMVTQGSIKLPWLPMGNIQVRAREVCPSLLLFQDNKDFTGEFLLLFDYWLS